MKDKGPLTLHVLAFTVSIRRRGRCDSQTTCLETKSFYVPQYMDTIVRAGSCILTVEDPGI